MPIYMDVHKGAAGATPEQIESAHLLDLAVQERYGVKYLRYWFNEPGGRVFCLVEAPSKEAAIAVHRESHAMLPDEIIEVQTQDVASFLGTMGENHSGTRLSEVPGGGGPGLDTALRTIMFTDMEGSTASRSAWATKKRSS